MKAKIKKLLVVLAVLAFVGLGSFLWDRSENEYDRKQLAAWELNSTVKISPEEIAKCEYLASSKSTVYHRRNCRYVRRIKKDNLIGFKEQLHAGEGGWQPCKICKP